MQTERRYEAVNAPTRTEAEITASKEYWLKRHRECVEALGVSVARLTQLGIPIPGIEERIDIL